MLPVCAWMCSCPLKPPSGKQLSGKSEAMLLAYGTPDPNMTVVEHCGAVVPLASTIQILTVALPGPKFLMAKSAT